MYWLVDVEQSHHCIAVRFGPEALQWKGCDSMRDYITHGLYQAGAVYLVGLALIMLWNNISSRTYIFVSRDLSIMERPLLTCLQWNYLLLTATFAYEMLFILSPSPSTPSVQTLSALIFTDPVAPSNSGWFGFFWPSRVARIRM